MNALANKFDGESFEILTISTYSNRKITSKHVTSYLKGEEATFKILFNGSRVQRLFKGRGTPNTFITDHLGNIRFEHQGFSKGLEKTFELQIAALLEEIER